MYTSLTHCSSDIWCREYPELVEVQGSLWVARGPGTDRDESHFIYVSRSLGIHSKRNSTPFLVRIIHVIGRLT